MKKYIGLGILTLLSLSPIVAYFVAIATQYGIPAAIKVFVLTIGFIGLLILGLKLYTDGDSR